MMTYPFVKTFNGKAALEFPEACFQRGRIYAVIGPNGSGKSTLARILSGIMPADESRQIWRTPLCVGYMPQRNYSFDLTVEQNILLNGTGSGKYERASKLMESVGLAAMRKQKAHSLSGGETARMAIARLMMKSYDLLILDEPTAAMDIHSTLQAEILLKEYVGKEPCAVIFITHMLTQAQRVADEVLFLLNGALLERGPSDTVLHQPSMRETKEFISFYNL